MDFLIYEPQGRRGVIRPHGALVVLKRYVRFWYFPHWVYTWISLVWGPAYFSWLVYYTTDMQITASLAGREAWFHFFICPLNFFCAGILQLPLGGMQGAVEGVVCRTAGGAGAGSRGGGAGRGGVGCHGGGCWGPRRGCWAGVVWGAVGAGAGSRGGGAGRGGVGCRGGGCWEPRRGYWAGWWGVPWGAGAGSRGGVAGRGGVGCRGGGCWEPRRGYWAWWWGCCGNWGWGPQRGQRRGSVGGAWGVVLGAAEGQIKLVWSPPLLLRVPTVTGPPAQRDSNAEPFHVMTSFRGQKVSRPSYLHTESAYTGKMC